MGHGKICYVELPARDVQAAAEFYRRVFGWNIRQRDNGETSFDDSVGEVSGLWDPNRTAVENPGMIVSIMVRDAMVTAGQITRAGGTIVDAPDPAQAEVHGTFRDPAGNLLSIYQQPGLA